MQADRQGHEMAAAGLILSMQCFSAPQHLVNLSMARLLDFNLRLCRNADAWCTYDPRVADVSCVLTFLAHPY